jgi:DNA repair protein RadC
MPRTPHCMYCPIATKKARHAGHMSPLMAAEEAVWPPADPSVRRQEQQLREAVAPYVCLAELRRVAASAEDIQPALKQNEPLPEEVRALLTILRVLLTPRPDERIKMSSDIAALLMVLMGHLDHEEMWIICLDMKNHVQRIHPLYKGTLSSAGVRTGELFRVPLLLNSASIIMVHNHPGGVPDPSEDDITVTQQVVQAGAILQIEVLDHLIIAQGGWVSMRDKRVGRW